MSVKKARPEIELEPDAWERFRSAVHVMTKAGPQHREPKNGERKPTKRTAGKGRARVGKARG